MASVIVCDVGGICAICATGSCVDFHGGGGVCCGVVMVGRNCCCSAVAFVYPSTLVGGEVSIGVLYCGAHCCGWKTWSLS